MDEGVGSLERTCAVSDDPTLSDKGGGNLSVRGHSTAWVDIRRRWVRDLKEGERAGTKGRQSES